MYTTTILLIIRMNLPGTQERWYGYEYRQGKGNVIRSMFRDIDAECYLMIDGDDTYPSENAREMVSGILEQGADMVIGDRLSSTYFTENKTPFHYFGNVLVRG